VAFQWRHYHENARFLTLANDAGFEAVQTLGSEIAKRVRIWGSDPRVLWFEAQRPDLVRATLPEPFLEFFRSATDREDGWTPEAEEVGGYLRCQHRLVELSRQPWAFWFHCGDHGLIYEYSLGLGRDTLMNYNECEVPEEPIAGMTKPASSLTAALRYLQILVDNQPEVYWIHGGLFSIDENSTTFGPKEETPASPRRLVQFPEWLRRPST
jgi:hypothetical protein